MTRHGWIRSLLVVGAALAAVPVVGLQPAAAQPAFALGRPLPDGSMDPGSVMVRVIAGSPSAPVDGAEVTLIVGGQPRTARTNAAGRATFQGLTAGASVQAKIQDAEGKELRSSTFAVPSSGGIRVMLSTKPFGGGGGGPAPAMGGGGGAMPEAKQMSGQPRPDRDTPAGSYVVRLTYNSLKIEAGKLTDPSPPVGFPVTLVGYVADNSVVVQTVNTDAEGRATFTDLDMTGGTGYFVLATLPRGTGVDRVFAMPTQLDGQAGVRAVLSGDKKDAGTPNLDQLATEHALPTPPGKVRITLEGVPPATAPVRVIDAATGQVVAQGPAQVMAQDPSTVQGGSKFEPKPDLPAHTLDVSVHGGATGDAPLGDVEIRIVAADAKTLDGPMSKTGADGSVRITAPAGGPHRAVFRVLGRDFVSEPFDISKAGGKLEVRATWSTEGRPQALLDVPFKPGQVLYAEATVDGKLAGSYRSLPFQPLAQKGTHVGVIVYPRVMLKFNMIAFVEDQLLGVQGRWTIENNSWIPYRETADGMIIPLPRGHHAGILADQNQNDVAVVPGEGFRIMRPLPPGNAVSFIGGFSMDVDGGNVDWALDLPYGTLGSSLQIRQTPGLQVDLPRGAHGSVKDGRDGNPYFVIEPITIGPKMSMAMGIRGLPSPPGWKLWAPRLIGLAVVLTLIGGVVFALIGRRDPRAQAAARRAALLDELVRLERGAGNTKRRDQVLAELEKLWKP